MTVASETTKVSYAGNGSTTEFAVSFYFLANADIRVILTDAAGDETVWAETTNYTLTGAGVAAGGTLTALVAPASGETLTIKRDISITQETDYVENDTFPAEDHERALDKLTMLIQQTNEIVGRGLVLSEGTTVSNLTLPEPEAGKALGWNSGETGIENLILGDASAITLPVSLSNGGLGASHSTVADVRSTLLVPGTGVANTFTALQRFAKGADVASASALALGTDGNYFDVTGTTSITSIGTLGVGTVVRLHFDAALTLTHHATDLILPTGANITTAAGDEATFIEYATGDWRCVQYQKADGTALAAAGGGSSGRVLLNSQTIASPVSTVEIGTDIDSTYDAYEIEISGVTASASTGTRVYCRLSNDGGSSWSSDYAYTSNARSTSVVNDGYGTGTAQIDLGPAANAELTLGGQMSATIKLAKPADASLDTSVNWHMMTPTGTGTGNVQTAQGSARNNTAQADDTVEISFSAAINITGGTFTLYGCPKA